VSNLVLRELHISYAFVRRDLSSAFVPAMLFTAAALASTPSPTAALVALGRAVPYFWLYTYTFCLSNQIVGLEEDRLNKPDRPIPRGLLSASEAMQRWVVASVVFTALAWWFGVATWSLLWQAVSIAHNFLYLSRSSILKCAFMSVGIVAQLAAAWALVTPLTQLAWTWILVIALVIFPTVSLQDLRDMAGDRRLGRRTLPLVVGEWPTRILLVACFAVLVPVAIYFVLLAPFGGVTAAVCEVVTVALSLVIAARILLYRDPAADHATYLLYTGWYCVLLCCAVLLF